MVGLSLFAREELDIGKFDVIRVDFEDGDHREFAAGLGDHALNQTPAVQVEEENLTTDYVLENYLDELVEGLEQGLEENQDFVRIAGRWFPRALLVDINIGHLNLAEASPGYGRWRSAAHRSLA